MLYIADYFIPITDVAESRLASTHDIDVPTKRLLMSISPNPTSDKAYIAYELPRTFDNATLKITNGLGQVVDIIDVSKYKYVYRLNCDSYHSGIYFVSLIVDDSIVETSKLNVMQN